MMFLCCLYIELIDNKWCNFVNVTMCECICCRSHIYSVSYIFAWNPHYKMQCFPFSLYIYSSHVFNNTQMIYLQWHQLQWPKCLSPKECIGLTRPLHDCSILRCAFEEFHFFAHPASINQRANIEWILSEIIDNLW